MKRWAVFLAVLVTVPALAQNKETTIKDTIYVYGKRAFGTLTIQGSSMKQYAIRSGVIDLRLAPGTYNAEFRIPGLGCQRQNWTVPSAARADLRAITNWRDANLSDCRLEEKK